MLESAVIAVPHGDLGEAPLGVLVAQQGADVDLEAITEALANQLARFKCPRKLVVVPELPRNTMGKVQKNVLRYTYSKAFD